MPGSLRPCPPVVLLLAAPLNSVNSVAGLCCWALCPGRCPPPLGLVLAAPLNVAISCVGWALCPGLVLLRTLSTLMAGLCVQASDEPCQLCGWALCPGLVLLLSPLGRTGLCVQVFCCPSLGCAPELCQLCGWLCGWALCPTLWLGSVSRPCLLNSVKLCGEGLCPGLVLLAAPLNSVNSVAGLCGWTLFPGPVLLLSSSWPRP